MEKKKFLAIAVLIALSFLAPLIIKNPYYLHLLILSYIYVILTVSYDIHVGHLGLFSFAQAAFFGVGLYTSAISATQLGLSFWLALPLSGIISGLVAFLMGIVILNLSVFSFKIASIAFYMIIYLVITNWVSFTGGPMGIKGIPSPTIHIQELISYTISTKLSYYYLILCFTLFIIFLIYKMLNSRIGRAFHAIRDEELRARAIGINTFKYKMIGFVTSGIFGGIGGSLWAFYIRIAHPHAFGASLFVTLLVMIVVGGLGQTMGIVAVAFALTFIPEFLRISGEFRQIIYGILLLVTVLFMPEGIGGKFSDILLSFKKLHRD